MSRGRSRRRTSARSGMSSAVSRYSPGCGGSRARRCHPALSACRRARSPARSGAGRQRSGASAGGPPLGVAPSNTSVPSTPVTRVLLTLTSRSCGVPKNRMSSRGRSSSPAAVACRIRSHSPCTPRHWSGCAPVGLERRALELHHAKHQGHRLHQAVLFAADLERRPRPGRDIAVAGAVVHDWARITIGPDLVSNTTPRRGPSRSRRWRRRGTGADARARPEARARRA